MYCHGATYPLYIITERSFCIVMFGSKAQTKAALPETCGAAIEVPSAKL